MAEATPQVLSHFGLYTFTDTYWTLPAAERTAVRDGWLGALRRVCPALHTYQAFPMEADLDLVLWSARPAPETDAAQRFFADYAAACAPYRRHVTLRDALWGFTRPSQYTKTRSRQEADPFGDKREPYLIIYPFVKTTEWYLKSREERQAMMMGHIKIGKQYEEITQLLLYSTGLQNQEFVVVYETPDPLRFLDLVTELPSQEARPYTLRDWPLHTAVYQPDAAALARWL